jgi:Flp pilus assembly protein TadD
VEIFLTSPVKKMREPKRSAGASLTPYFAAPGLLDAFYRLAPDTWFGKLSCDRHPRSLKFDSRKSTAKNTRTFTMRIAAFSIAAICISVLAAGCGGAQSRLATHMQQGRLYFSQGNFSKASVEFRNAIQIAPKDPAARVMAGRAAEELGAIRDAAGLYQSAIDASPDDVEARANLARVFIFGGSPERGLALIQPVFAKHPNEVSLLTYRAAARLQLKDPAGARADIDRALQLAPTNVEAVSLRASMYRNAGDLDKAAALINATLLKMPSSTDLREVLADIYETSGDSSRAESQLRALVDLKPQEARYRYQLAVFYSGAHRTDDAQRVLEAAVQVLPHSDGAKLALVDFIYTQRSAIQGERALQDFIARDPGNYDLRLALGALLERAGTPQAALAAYDEVIRRDGTGLKGLTARDRVAAIAVVQGRLDDAQKLIDEVLQHNPRDNDALVLRGKIALTRTDAAAAIGDLRAVLRDQPETLGVRRLLAQAYLANGQPGLAEETLRTGMDLAPADASLRVELAELLVQTQRAEQAVAMLEPAARAAPTDERIRELLARAYLAKQDFASARTTAHDLQTLRPDSASGFFLAGLAAQGQKQFDDAQKEFERALAVQPRAPDVLSALARLEVERGQTDKAIALVKGAADRDPTNANALNLLGELYVAQKNFPLATAALSRATQVAPAWTAPYRNLAIVKYMSGDTDGAIAAYVAGIKAVPSDPKLVTELALLYEKHGRVDDAIASYDAWHRQNPKVQIVANNLAMLLVTYKKDRTSLDRARDLVAGFASSDDATLLDTNGWVHLKRAEYAEALPVLERAVESAPASKEAHFHLAMAELHVGQTARARHELETALVEPARFSGADEARTALVSLNHEGNAVSLK